jgi:NADP-dependent 3-hydroxy acid dehydrogenase YdfG/nitroimidazol reductase NimA-like FMN-containing flavoprotein (pyridoxamine 5'-phosphate oxidase superfamily)
MKRLEGKVAIVTGGGSGIGQAAARMLAAEGAAVVVAGRRLAPLETVVADIAASGGRAAARQADIANPADAVGLARWTVERYGRVDVLVNNAGHSSRVRNIQWLGPAEWDSVLAVNLTGVFVLTQAVLPGMIARGGGTIVTVSSAAALRPGLIGGAVYGAAKAAVRNLMGHIHTVLRDQGIRASTILPAEVDTPILANRPLPPDAAARATMMQAEDVASAILLCVTMPERTVIEEIVLSPTIPRDGGLEPGEPAEPAGGRRAGGDPMRLKKAVASLIQWERVSRVATAGTRGMPHLVPVCHVLDGGTIYFASGSDGRKVLNLRDNARLALTVDLYAEDWSHLKGVMVQGRARLITGGPRFRRIRALLYRKYPQYPAVAALEEEDSVVVELTPTHVFSWGMG